MDQRNARPTSNSRRPVTKNRRIVGTLPWRDCGGHTTSRSTKGPSCLATLDLRFFLSSRSLHRGRTPSVMKEVGPKNVLVASCGTVSRETGGIAVVFRVVTRRIRTFLDTTMRKVTKTVRLPSTHLAVQQHGRPLARCLMSTRSALIGVASDSLSHGMSLKPISALRESIRQQSSSAVGKVPSASSSSKSRTESYITHDDLAVRFGEETPDAVSSRTGCAFMTSVAALCRRSHT